MIRVTKQQSTGKCTLGNYIGMLISEPKSPTCTTLANTINISHDSANRFLEREDYEPKDLFDQACVRLNLTDGIVSVDDTVIDKPYSKHMDLVGFYYSGKHHKAVKGINLITLYYTDLNHNSQPINYRIYNPADNKTKNDYFLEMLDEVLIWGVKPRYVTADAWYSPTKNLKHITNHGVGLMVAVKSNRTVSLEKGSWIQVQTIDEIAETGINVWLKDFGDVQLFRTYLKDQARHYILVHPPKDDDNRTDTLTFKQLHDSHWQIETYHRALKQLCSVEKFQVRRQRLIRNHIFASIMGFVYLKQNVLQNCLSIYAWARSLFTDIVANVSNQVADDWSHLNPKLAEVRSA